jgi:thiamine biosynthesis lipoprotein
MTLHRHSRTVIAMDTLVTATAITEQRAGDVRAELDRALRWFFVVESACTRFDPRSEVSRLASRPGTPVPVGPIVLGAVEVALAVAEASGGAFDPTVGAAMQQRGYDRNYRTGTRVRIAVTPAASWRDVVLDREAATILLRRALLLDLGAVAKGLAVDLALGELTRFPGAVVEAGGDLRVRGPNEHGEPWRVGVRDPRRGPGCVLLTGDAAVCTSAGYARPAPGGGHHLLDPRSGVSQAAVLSATAIAPTCAAADALATAAFVLGPARGIDLLEREGVEGVILTRHGRRQTQDLESLASAT